MQHPQENRPSQDEKVQHLPIAESIKSEGMAEGESNDAQSAPADVTSQPKYVTGWKLFSVLASLVLIFFLVLLDMSIVATATPNITSQFHSLHDVGWYGSAYLLSSAALQPLTGKIYTRINTKWTFISFFGLFEFGSLLCGVAQSSTMLIIGRAVAGMGGSGLMNGGIQIIYLSVPGDRRPALTGILMSISQLGLVGGPLVGGVLTEYASWRWCFYINLPIGAVATLCMVFVQVPDRKKAQAPGSGGSDAKSKIKSLIHDLDLKGFVLFAGFAVMVALALQWGGIKYSWTSGTIIGLFVGGGLSLAVFAAQEYRIGDRAMIPWSVVKQTVVWSSSATMFFYFGSQMLGNYYLPIYFQTVRNASPAMSGVYLLPTIFGTMLMSLLSGVLVSRWGYYMPWTIASAILAGVGNGLLSTLQPNTSTVKWIWYQIITGLGRGSGMAMTIIAIQHNLPPIQVPIGQALIMFQQTFGGAFFLAIGQTLFNSSLEDALKKFAPSVSPQVLVHAGASGVRDVISRADLPGVLKAYNVSVQHEFYLGAACSAITLLTCMGMGWAKVTKEKDTKVAAEASKGAELSDKV